MYWMKAAQTGALHTTGTATMTNKRMLRPKSIYGRGGRIPVGHSKFFEDFVLRPGGPKTIPGTNVPRLQMYALGPRAVAAFENDVDAVLEGLRAEGDATRRRKGGAS
jgi:hypothetical protein